MKRLILSSLMAAFAGHASAALVNGGFEAGVLSPWQSAGSSSVLTGLNYGFGTVAPQEGSQAARVVSAGFSAANLAALMGISEAALEATNGGLNAIDGAMIYQSTSASAGDSFTFWWNFVEQDYLPYDDWAFYGVRLNGGPATVNRFASLATVGPDGGATVNGWSSLVVNITQAGNYTFYFGVVNALDSLNDSDLWIDGIAGTGSLAVPEPGSLPLLGIAAAAAALIRRRKCRE